MSSNRTKLAKVVFWIGGFAMWVKWPTRMYHLDMDNPDAEIKFTPAERSWQSWDFAFRLLGWSEDIDPGHWEHWALDHSDCPTYPCRYCGGVLCERD
jgi:hypothetical protein